MRPRDRLGLTAVLAVVLIGAVWLLLVSPERAKVTSLSKSIASEQTSLTQAQAQLDTARGSVAAYVGNIHGISTATRAVPTTPAESELIKTLVKLAGTKVDFKELDVGGSTQSAAGPYELGLTFTFAANYGNLQSFLTAVDALTTTDGSRLASKGRLFTIQSVSLAPHLNGSTTANIVASVYQQAPGSIGATAATGATGVAP
jgi:hypothetical protein